MFPPLLSKFSVVSAFCRYSQFACCSGKNNRVHTIHYTQNCHAFFLLSRLKNLFNLWVGASGATFCASALYMFIWTLLGHSIYSFIEFFWSQLAITEYPFSVFPVDNENFRAITSSLDSPNTMMPRLWAIHPCFGGPSMFLGSFLYLDSAGSFPFSRYRSGVSTETFVCVCVCRKIYDAVIV